MKIGFVIPSRLKSTRLPRKNLIHLGGQTALEWAIERAQNVQCIDEVVVATTPLKSDADITKVCASKGIRYFLGDPVDVLKRIRDTAEYFDFDFVINITPDNTLFSMYLIDLMANKIRENPSADYLKFKDVMLGTGIYALKKEALQTVCEFKEIIDTEIWGPLFYDKYFNVIEMKVPQFLQAGYRLTMDTPEDYRMLRKIYSDLKITSSNLVELEEVIHYLDLHPEVAAINSNIRQTAISQDVIMDIKQYFEKNESSFYKIRDKYYGGRND